MQTEVLQRPETKVIYRIYKWNPNIADWKGIAGFHDQAEALTRYAAELKYGERMKLTKETQQVLLIEEE